MDLLSLFLIAVGLSMDAFAVSVCKGLATPKYKLKYSMICGAWFGGFQALMPAVGYLLGVNFKKYITAIDHWIAFVLLALIGFNMIREALKMMTRAQTRHSRQSQCHCLPLPPVSMHLLSA